VNYAGLRPLVQDAFSRIVDFAQRVISTPSLSGEEEAVAQLVASEMRALAYDDVEADDAGNVVGRLAGGDGRRLWLHAHMDTVAPGDLSRWTHDPYGAEISGGYLWGRGASDTKGSLVAQVYALGLLKKAGLVPPGEVWQTAVVCEEMGGLGTRLLLDHHLPDIAVIGEPSSNTLRRGHRGRYEWVVTLHGRPAHASAPDRGVNPHYSMSRFLLALREQELLWEPVFGGTSVAPTLAYVSGSNSNVIPGEMTVHLDWRAAPGDTVENARATLESVLAETLEDQVTPEIRLRKRRLRTFTGVEREIEFRLSGYCLPEDDPDLVMAHQALERSLGRPVDTSVWTFCTDGGHIAVHGVPCVGFGPGSEAMAHVYDERLSVAELLEATIGYMGLAMTLGASRR